MPAVTRLVARSSSPQSRRSRRNGWTTPAEEALARIGTERVERILADLSEDQRAVLLLRFVGDMSIEDIAKALGKRQGAIKALQRRGLAAVKRQLSGEGVSR